MASTYTDIGTELMTTGENAGNWGTKTNTNLKIIEEAIRGYVAISANSDQTLSLTDGSTGDSIRNAVIAFTGTLSANRTITVPSAEKWWIMDNQTAGAYTLTVKVSGQTGITWGASDKGTKILYSNGTDIVDTNVGGGVGAFDLNGNELTLDADADTSITASTDDQIDIEIAGADDFTFTANAFNVLTGSHATFADSANAKFGTGNDMLLYHDGSNSYITNSQGALKVATETSGIAVTIGHTTSETTIADNLTVTGTLTGTLATAAQGSVTSLGTLTTLTVDNIITNGTTIGHTSDTDLMTLADGVLTVAGELDATTLDISGNADIDGTTNLDAVDIDGAVQIDAAVTVGVDDTGYDVKFFGDTASAYMLWDTSADDLVLAGAAGIDLAGDIDVDGTANLDNTDIDGTLAVDGTTISLDATTSLNIDNSNTSNGITIGTATSGVPISIGHTTSEVTVNDNLTVTGTLTLGSNAELTEAELEFLDGITAGTAAASKAMVADANIDITGGRNITISGELDAATLDISGNADIDGTTNLDAVDIDGAVQLDATLTIGANDQGYDVILYGDTASANVTWDTSADDLIFNGGAGLIVPDGQLTLGSTAVSSTAAELNLLDTASANSVVNSKAVIYGSSGELAGTLSTAAQTSVTSLGTLTALTVDDVAINGKVVTMTGSSSDTAVFTAGTHGTLSIVTTDDAAAAANMTLTADGTFEAGGTTVTLDSAGDVVLDAGGADVFLKDDGTLFGTLTQSGGELVIKSSSSGTTALTFSGANATLAGDLTISGDDLTMATNTSGAALIADGTNFNPVVISGDISIATNGAASIAANSVDGTHIALGSDAAGDIIYYNGTNYIRLAKGDDDQVLTLASGVPSWGTSSGIGMGKAIAAALVFG